MEKDHCFISLLSTPSWAPPLLDVPLEVPLDVPLEVSSFSLSFKLSLSFLNLSFKGGGDLPMEGVIYPSGGGDLPHQNTSPRAPLRAKNNVHWKQRFVQIDGGREGVIASPSPWYPIQGTGGDTKIQ